MAAVLTAARCARVLDGETLWLALESDVPAVTLRYAGGGLTESTAPEPGGLVSARVQLAPLAELPGDRLEVSVLAGEGRRAVPISWAGGPVPGPVRAAIPTRDRRWRWRVAADDGVLGLVRVKVEPGVAVTRIEADPDRGDVRLELAGGRTMRVAAADDDLTVDGLALVRAYDDLKRPNFAVALPELGDGTRLRWTPEGRLSLNREVEEVAPRSGKDGAPKGKRRS